jgi:hypothetical protein
MLSRAMRENKTKMRERGLTKCGEGHNKVFAVSGVAEKWMKQNEKIDDQFGIKASNLQSTNCECFTLRIGHQAIDAVVEVKYTTGKWGV